MAFISLFFINCKRDSDNGYGVSRSNHINIAYINSSGENLLNPSTLNHYTADSIRIYYIVDGVKTEANFPKADYPNGFHIYQSDSTTYRIGVLLNSNNVLIKLNHETTDTIKCIIDHSYGNLELRKLWYNGVLMFDNDRPTLDITVVK